MSPNLQVGIYLLDTFVHGGRPTRNEIRWVVFNAVLAGISNAIWDIAGRGGSDSGRAPEPMVHFVFNFWQGIVTGSPFMVAEGIGDLVAALGQAIESWYHGDGFNICKFEGFP
jgi:hypothetical protein